MIRFLANRLLWMVLTLWAVFTISFALMHAVPGGPFDSERALEPEVKRNIEKRFHLDEPRWRQYLRELGNVARFDLGPSYRLPDFTVNEIISQGFPVSASLGLLAMFFALSLGLTAGIVSAVWRQSPLDLGLMSLATVGVALPEFVVASLAIVILVFVWPIFPAGGWGSVQQLILPSLCLGAPFAAYIARLARTGMLDVLSQDYIRTARAKGLGGSAIVFRHAFKGAMLPVLSYLGPALAGILTGSLVEEQIFAIPGLGMHFLQAATQRDYTLSMGLVLLYTTLLYSLNTIVDLCYTLLDPRVKLES